MRGRLAATVTFVLLALMPVGSARAEEAFQLLDVEKQIAEPLSYYVRHAPEGFDTDADPARKVVFGPLPEGVSAHFVEVGYLHGCCLVAVRYLQNSRLDFGNTGAVGIALLCEVPGDPRRFAPVIVDWDLEGVIEDFSVSPIRQFGNFSFFWLRKEYSGTGHFVERTAIVAGEDSKLRTYEIFDKVRPLEELTKQGWESWHRGNYFDEDTLTGHYHFYRDSTKAARTDESSHREVVVPYEFRDGKLRPGKVRDVEESGRSVEGSSD